MAWKLEGPAIKAADLLYSGSPQVLPVEVMRIDDDTAAIVIDLDGVDYILSMQVVPKQRNRPTSN